jgi:hypothetical protein
LAGFELVTRARVLEVDTQGRCWGNSLKEKSSLGTRHRREVPQLQLQRGCWRDYLLVESLEDGWAS